jgi:hypothetical protein
MDVKGFVEHAFRGQTRRLAEACAAGALTGLGWTALQMKLTDIEQNMNFDSSLSAMQDLGAYDPEIPLLCDALLRMTRLFLPSMVDKTVEMVSYYNDLGVCYLAVCADPVRHSSTSFMAYTISKRIKRTISDITVLFPHDSPSRSKSEEIAQKLYDYQDAMYCEIRGMVRLAQIA